MEAKHTPGPWINDGKTISAPVAPDESQTYIAPVAFIEDGWTEDMQNANARLIAAAPDLLVAAEELLALLSAGPAGDDTDSKCERSRIAALQAAVAKAEGR